MANPQKEDGHVDIANEIVEALARIRISGEEMQCLWIILRKTYGWHKKEDKISLSQFSQLTGLKRQNVLRAINKLSSKKIIGIIKNDSSQINIYNINKDFDKWEPLPKKITLSSKKITTVINIDNRVSSKKIHTKETITKETIQKKYILSDEEFLSSLKNKFTWVDFDTTMVRLDAWLLANPGRKKTRRFIVGWLNKIEKPLQINKNEDPESFAGEKLWLKIKEEQDERNREREEETLKSNDPPQGLLTHDGKVDP